jgi:hypothetical protein
MQNGDIRECQWLCSYEESHITSADAIKFCGSDARSVC